MGAGLSDISCCCADKDDGLEVTAAGVHSAMETARYNDERFQEATQRKMSMLVVKRDAKDPLGMDVRHVRARLVVIAIRPEGAVHRANIAAQSRQPPGDEIKVNDTIVEVNGKETDPEMVKECQNSLQLNITFVRRGQGY
eukprot:gb/GFBE01081067.1/.p1 GENE.gb/GFBE01081067.1/~~gb/GFBE01081067.1/.p1  ORF type:complete len:140 (+),score=25.49 gb/GFBE01081067.1/:1-420(+)